MIEIRKQIIELRGRRLKEKIGSNEYKILTNEIYKMNEIECLCMAKSSKHYKKEFMEYAEKWREKWE